MRIEQTASLSASRQRVWDALSDFSLLARVLPGVEQLTPVSADACDLVIKLLVPTITGTYRGTVRVVESDPIDSYRLAGEARGRLGWVRGESGFRLAPADGDATELTMAMAVQAGGALATVGQRFMEGVARTMVKDFLQRLEEELTAAAPAATEGEAEAEA